MRLETPGKHGLALMLALAVVATGRGTAETNPVAGPAKPVYGEFGLDVAGADPKSRPGDDFFRYANGAWLDHTLIPADRPAWTLRLEMSERTAVHLHDLLDHAQAARPDTLEGKAGAFYASFMDEGRVEMLGAKPIGADLASVRATADRDALG